ncbi:hypothetical protein VIN7_8911 [Saccharomyces cerevisiae x Saccharomyces kudriavzevii VIN7]|uniref:Uncharacterized protein n=1 Tax=Saccharomyces cerevisiae x Saccharomyces kudriavzevii (strain VIN7) TaxID=1095631 RepID=H0GYR0_SACCK|nr:hypothetical protein VIN7_8911 [Saccharomyces cerevisiae x Saccharomyces kudriavzevii VIN7]
MAIPVKDETRNVDDNMSAQVQSKAKTIDTTKEFQKLSIDTSIENKQRKQALIDLETYEIFLNKLTTKKDKITNEVKQDDDISNLDQLMELDEKIDKMQETITSRDRKQRAVSAIIQHRGKTFNFGSPPNYLFSSHVCTVLHV